MAKMTRDEAEKMVGKRTPLPSQKGAGGLNDLPKTKTPPPKDSRMGNLADPLGLKKSMRDREAAAGLKAGGMVRGTGCATKGKKFSGVK